MKILLNLNVMFEWFPKVINPFKEIIFKSQNYVLDDMFERINGMVGVDVLTLSWAGERHICLC